MPIIKEGNLSFDFPAGWTAVKYDETRFYVEQFQRVSAARGVDIVAIDLNGRCWLIEVKDYRKGHQTGAATLAKVVAEKMRDTLAGLATARVRATGSDQHLSQLSMNCVLFRVVLHMENPNILSPLFTQAINMTNVQLELKRLLRPIDPGLRVVDIKQNSLYFAWTVS